MSLQQVFGTSTPLASWSTALSSVAAGGTSTSGNVSIAQPAIKLECEFTLDGAGSETGDIFLLSSTDGGTGFSTTEANNMLYIGAVEFNGTTLVRKVFHIEQLPDDWKIYIKNNSAQGLGTSVISYQSVTVDNV